MQRLAEIETQREEMPRQCLMRGGRCDRLSQNMQVDRMAWKQTLQITMQIIIT